MTVRRFGFQVSRRLENFVVVAWTIAKKWRFIILFFDKTGQILSTINRKHFQFKHLGKVKLPLLISDSVKRTTEYVAVINIRAYFCRGL